MPEKGALRSYKSFWSLRKHILGLKCRLVQQRCVERSSRTFESKAAGLWANVEGTGWLFLKVRVGA